MLFDPEEDPGERGAYYQQNGNFHSLPMLSNC